MTSSQVRIGLFLLLLAAVGWLAWRPSGGARARGERAQAPALVAEVAPAPAALVEPRREVESAARVEAVSAVDPAAPAVPTGGVATLSVHVVEEGGGAPLAGLGVVLHEPEASWSTEPSTESRGGVGHLLTDAAGNVEYEVPSGVAFELRVNTLVAPVAGSATRDVPALAPGERRELVVELATRLDLAWYGRIVDEAGAPLADARVERVLGNPFTQHTGRETALSGADGLVRLAFASWCTAYARVELDGYATGFANLDGGHEQPSSALSVRLARAAALELRVTEPGGAPREGLDVRVSRKAYESMQGGYYTAFDLEAPPFAGRTDAQGSCTLEGLPPELALTVELLEGETLLRHEERSLRLEPGERRALRWTVGGRCTLAGRTLEADGSPAAGVTVWLLPDDGRVFLGEHREDDVTARARSDADGRFTLEVAAGTWLVGPAPGQSGARGPAGPLPDIAPVAERLAIAPEQASAEVTLTCWRGLFLTGTVRRPDGQLVSSGYVDAQREGVLAGDNFSEGVFSIGPLPPGAYAVSASGFGEDGAADSAPQTVAAGTEGIELVLRRGASLAVRVLDANGNPSDEAMVWILPEPGSEGGFGTTTSGGAVTLDGFLPGTFSVSAATQSGEFALARGVTLAAGTPRTVELRLAPAPRLRITILPKPEPRTSVEVRLDGAPVTLVFADQSPVTALAPGEYELVLQRLGGGKNLELQRQRVRVAPEGETRAVFDLAAPR